MQVSKLGLAILFSDGGKTVKEEGAAVCKQCHKEIHASNKE